MLIRLILIFSLLLAGYAAGRRIGMKEGTLSGKKGARLELLGASLDRGECQLCHRSFDAENIAENDSDCYAHGFLIQWSGEAGSHSGKSNTGGPAHTENRVEHR